MNCSQRAQLNLAPARALRPAPCKLHGSSLPPRARRARAPARPACVIDASRPCADSQSPLSWGRALARRAFPKASQSKVVRASVKKQASSVGTKRVKVACEFIESARVGERPGVRLLEGRLAG